MDLDGDGNLDILSGSYSRDEQPMAGLFQVLWGKAGGQFQKATPLTGTDGKPLEIATAQGADPNDTNVILERICTRATAVDFDHDGDLDLVVGNFAGGFYWFEGEGQGKFAPQSRPIQSGSEPLKINGYHSDPFLVDWDGDGDLDMLSGSDLGGVQWAENQAGPGKTPEFSSFAWLIEPTANPNDDTVIGHDEVTGPSDSTRVWADDVNGDGKLDLLVGDRITLRSPAEGVTREQFEKEYAQWHEDMQQVINRLTETSEEITNLEISEGESGGDDAEAAEQLEAKQKEALAANDAYVKLLDKARTFMVEDRTGYVWLFLQK